jgi:hypothetical protein
MRRLVSLSLLLPLLLLLAGPVRSADDKMPTSSWYPLAVGNTWQYRVGENHYTLKVAKHEKIGTQLCARLEMSVKNKVISHEHVAVTSDAIVRTSFEGKVANPPIPFLKLPPKKDQSWKVESKMAGQVFKGTFKAGEEEVKVPAGTYKTVTVTGQDLEVNGVKMTLTYYFADKVGMVRQVIEMAGQKIIVEMEKFEPAKS